MNSVLLTFSDANFPFQLYSYAHMIPLGILLGFSIVMYGFRRQLCQARINKAVRCSLALLLVLQEVSYQVWVVEYGYWHIGSALPLHLCGVTALLSAVMLIKRSGAIFEIVYFWGLAGASQALFTPDLGNYSFPHFLYYKFFLSHMAIILAVLFMTWVESCRPTLKSVGKTLLATNGYALLVGMVNYFAGGNYLYLCSKPQGASLLDYLGPWPWYILSLEIILVISCLICYLPCLPRDMEKPKVNKLTRSLG